jgi:ribosomal protein S18 acetylase RimI-like enzyme
VNETVHLSASSPDSRRFGIQVERGAIDVAAPMSDVVEAVTASNADLIILRISAGRTDIPTALQRMGEFVLHADTLVYYGIDLPAASGAASTRIRMANMDDRGAIEEIAKASFRTYRAHYAANPLIPANLGHQGYVQWAQSRLDITDDTSATWVALDGDTIAGFATCDRTDGIADIILNAVHPDFERRGHYGTLLSHLLHHHGERGDRRLVISTQVWNYTVQRQWARAGLLLETAYDTYHLDRRMRDTVLDY